MKFLLLEKLIATYFKSATNGRVISLKLSRILTLVIVLVLIWGLFESYNKVLKSFAAAKQEKELSSLLTSREERQQRMSKEYELNYSVDDEISLLAQKQVMEQARQNHWEDNFEKIHAKVYKTFPDSMSLDTRIQYVEGQLNKLRFDKKELEYISTMIYQIKVDRDRAFRDTYDFLFLFYFVAILFLLPWLSLRVLFWIIDANKPINDV